MTGSHSSKGAWPNQKKKKKHTPWKLRFWILIKEESWYFSDYRKFRRQVCFIYLDGMYKKGDNVHKVRLPHPKLTVFYGTSLIFAHTAFLLCTALGVMLYYITMEILTSTAHNILFLMILIETATCMYRGIEYEHGSNWTSLFDPCEHCSCDNGNVECYRELCEAECTNPVPKAGECCHPCTGNNTYQVILLFTIKDVCKHFVLLHVYSGFLCHQACLHAFFPLLCINNLFFVCICVKRFEVFLHKAFLNMV